MGSEHRRWANFINARGRLRGHLFDGRYANVGGGGLPAGLDFAGMGAEIADPAIHFGLSAPI
jgi:hypothetical protein